MLRVDTMAELFDAVETLALTQPQSGDRLAILTNGGGPGVMAADALIAQGGRLASLSPATVARLDAILPRTWSRGNPVDIIGDAPGRRYADTLAVLMKDEAVDAVLVLNCPTALGSPTGAAQAVIEAVRSGEHPATSIRPGLATTGRHPRDVCSRKARMATYDTPDDAVQGFMHRVRYRRNQDLLMQVPRNSRGVHARRRCGTVAPLTAHLRPGGAGSTPRRCRAFLVPTAFQRRERVM